ncbi:hypothetical protein [Mammaliicoccus sciuri]|uniref:hypothetical protein n=1 Tax=Mammaliicoccus sciuri TaxID=1296 RepID=UPI001E563EDC|nr:hypothetical protein [Mammaliicoccus sciuri]MCD8896575.1 hypothetical protein [Mammaliicoccus sciuri]
MDKDILNYLDQVGQYIQGASEKGFETYVHGVFVESLIYSILGFIMVVISIIAITLIFKKMNYTDDALFWSIMPSLLGIFGVVLITFKVTGVIAPDYVVIKEIVKGISGK